MKFYFEAVSNLRDEKEMTVDDVKSILKMDYEKIEDEYNSEDTSRYLFASDFGEDAYIDVETRGTKVKDIDLKIYLGENANYTVSLSATNENVIDFMNKRVVIEDDRPYDVDKTFKVKLKKGELLKINLEMENGKSLSIPIVITLQDLSNGEYIYSKSVDNTDENIFTTEKVDKDGEYEISVLMSDLEKYKFEISLVKEYILHKYKNSVL